MEDSEIILLLKNEPSRGICEAVKRYRPYAAAIIGRVLGNSRQDIEECVADSFVAVWKIAQSGEEIRSLKGCISCAARNTAINRYKKLRREHSENTKNIDELELPAQDDVVLEFEDSSNAQTVQQLVYAMDEPDREIFARKYFLMESVKEIAKRTMLDEVQIKNRLYRGRVRLRRQLEERDVTA